MPDGAEPEAKSRVADILVIVGALGQASEGLQRDAAHARRISDLHIPEAAPTHLKNRLRFRGGL